MLFQVGRLKYVFQLEGLIICYFSSNLKYVFSVGRLDNMLFLSSNLIICTFIERLDNM